jgi:Uncharacterized protein conserved in bacteria (DUF2252)
MLTRWRPERPLRERRLVFDINDFDETLPGPFEWDVKRLAASLAVAGWEGNRVRHRGEDLRLWLSGWPPVLAAGAGYSPGG